MATMTDLLSQALGVYDQTATDLTTAQKSVASLTDQLTAAQGAYNQMATQVDQAYKDKAAAEAATQSALSRLSDKQTQIDALNKQVADLQAQVNPPASPNLIDPELFRERLAPAFLAYTALPSDSPVLAKWQVLLNNYFPPTRTTPVNVTSPATIGLVQTAVADGLLTPEQAAAVLAPNA